MTSGPAVKVIPGDGATLGAIPRDGGVNLAVASGIAEEVTLCLFDAGGNEAQVPLVNAWWEPITFTVPEARPGQEWRTEIDSFDPSVPAEGAESRHAGDQVTVRPRSLTVLRSPRG